MNKHLVSLVVGLCSLAVVRAQVTPQYIRGEKGPHQNVWLKVEQQSDESGRLVTRTNVAYVELAAGLNRLEGGKWVDANPTIQPAPRGGAIATGAQHEVRFAENLNTPGAIELKTPEGRPMRSHVVGLAYQDLLNGGEVLIAEVKDCQGYLVGNNQVVYKDAFEGIKADVRYTYSRDGFEQDIILQETPPEPELFGMDPETTDLLVLTEFVEADEPVKKLEPAPTKEVENFVSLQKKNRPRVPDEELEFGSMKIGHGQAFKMENGARTNAASVNKQWALLDGRRFLIERVSHRDVLHGMAGAASAEVADNSGASGLLNQVRPQLSLPARRIASAPDSRPMLHAQASTEGYVIDYYLGLVSQSNYTLRGDTTYLVNGPITLSGTTTVEGGTVVKYGKSVGASLTLGTTIWKTDPYRQAIFTSKDDNTVGEEVPGSTGSPSGYYANYALILSQSTSVRHVRISSALYGIVLGGSTSLDLRHAQILDCAIGVNIGTTDLSHYAGNVLFHRVSTAFEISTYNYYSLTMEHITFRTVSTGVFADFLGEFHVSSTIFRNCLFSGVSMVTDTGGCCCCCCCCCCGGNNMGVSLISSYQGLASSAFVAVGGGSNYLANPNLYPGTTAGLNASLLADIKTRTEYAPTAVTTAISTATVWPAIVLRDNDATPDAGYHYAPLDYFVTAVNLTASLTLSNGVAVGLGGSSGFISGNGSRVISSGAFVPMNRVASYQNVQEQPPAVASGSFDPLPGNVFILFNSGTDATRQFQFRFTDLSVGQGLLGIALRSGAAMPPFQTISFQDCWIRGCTLAGTFFPTAAETVNLLNNLIIAAKVDLNFNSANMGGPPGQKFPVNLNCYNNLFKGANTTPSLALTYTAGSPAFGNNWNVKDNLFDNAAQTLTVDTGGDARVLRSNNGFISGTVNTLGGANNITGITANYQTSPISQQRHGVLVGFFYPTSGAGTLFDLVNAGSRTAPNAGLYHYTTFTNQTKESSSQVDIGYHYPSVDNLGNMLDSDQDGKADIFEDLDGDGVVDIGETKWAATVSVQAAIYSDAWESGEDPGVYTVTRDTDNLSVPTTVTITMSGTATSGTDYPSLGTTVTIPIGLSSFDVYLWPFNDGVPESTETATMTLAYSDKYILGTPNATVSIHDGSPLLVDPKAPGSFTFSSAVYASSGVQQIPLYMSPSANYTISRRLDISPFYNAIDSGSWGFDATSVPINGILRVPDGSGPFPLAIFVHGNHDPFAYSDPGYVYLCELLASRGIIASTIDCNFLNGFSFGENGARGIVHLEHVRQFLIWNATPGHPLYGKVDTNNIMIVGHSRGGEGVGHAAYFNTYTNNDPVVLDGSAGLGPYFLNLKAVVAIAPVDQQYVPTGGPFGITNNYLIFHGSRDSDVSDFEGYLTYDRAQPIDLANPTRDAKGFKALAWIVGANHNHFNSTWPDESGGAILLTRAEQEDVAKVYISAMASVTLQGQKVYQKFLKNHAVGVNWLPTSGQYVSQYQSPNRLFIDHYEEDSNTATVSPPVLGTNAFSAANFSEMFFQSFFPVWIFEETHGARLEWSAATHFYQATFTNTAGLNATSYGHLALRIGQSSDSANPFNTDQDLRIIVQDKNGVSTSFTVSNISQLLYPDPWFPKTVMQTIRIPLNVVRTAGLDVSRLAFVKLVFDQTSTGVVYFDEIQLSN